MIAIQYITDCFSAALRSHLKASLWMMVGTCMCFSAGLQAASADKEAAINAQRQELDWRPLESLTDEQKKLLPTACCGAYVAPERDDPEANLNPEEASLFGRAQDSESEKQNKITLNGDVRLVQGSRTISTDKFFLDKETSQAELSGNIEVREPGLLFRADHAKININSGDADLQNSRFVVHETRVRGSAVQLQKVGDSKIILKSGQFTSCEPGDNTWDIRGSNITLHNDKHYGTAQNMRLNVEDIPVAYVPYFRFPIGSERLTGFLFPSAGLDDSKLGEFSAPFYWNIAPNYDATVEPRYLRKHGYMMQNEFRHLSDYFESTLSGSFLQNDRGLEQEADYAYTGEDRWQWKFEQDGGKNQAWKTRINYTDVSDTDYLRDVDGSAVDLNRQAYLQQMGEAQYNFEHWVVSARAEEIRLLTSGSLPYRELPRLQANGIYNLGDWILTANNEYTHFAVNRYYTGDNDNLIVGERFRSFYQYQWNKEFLSGYIKPGAGVKTLAYQLEADNFRLDGNSSPRFATPQVSLDAGLFFERDTQIAGQDYLQTFEPRLLYLYRDYENQDQLFALTTPDSLVNFDSAELQFTYDQLFRDSRFSGGDRIDDANQITLGVSSRYIESVTGVERVKLSLGEIIYFRDKEITLGLPPETDIDSPKTSDLAGQIVAQIGDSFQLTQDVVFDHQKNQFAAASTSLHYLDERHRIFNLTYRYARDPVTVSPLSQIPSYGKTMDQLDISTIWPVSDQWSIIMRSNYDFTYKAKLDTFAGLEYNDCCYRVRILARKWANFDFSPNFLEDLSDDDYEQAVLFEVQLKGFGTLAKRINNLLEKAVVGYSDRESSIH